MKWICLLSLVLIVLPLDSHEMMSPSPALLPAGKSSFKNLHQVNAVLFRSDQPSKKGMKELDSLGIRTVINLRNRVNDECEAKGTRINLIHYPINAWKMNQHDLVRVLQLIDTCQKPVLIHCLHGSDRTGAVVAGYRIVFENWTTETAVSEFRKPDYGFHEKWFGNILDMVQTLDPDSLRWKVYGL